MINSRATTRRLSGVSLRRSLKRLWRGQVVLRMQAMLVRLGCCSQRSTAPLPWFHLSRQENCRAIVSAEDKRALVEGFLSPRVPDQSHGETGVARLCIAPTIWQCAVSLPFKDDEHSVRLHVFILDVQDPIEADDSVRDRDMSSEHWIVEETIDRCGGEILMRAAGRIVVDERLKTRLKVEYRKRKRAGKAVADAEVLACTDGSWSLKP